MLFTCFCILITLCCVISWAFPTNSRNSLRQSALRALEGSIRELASPSLDVDKYPSSDWSSSPNKRATALAKRLASKAAEKLSRVTPYQAKRVAAAQHWRCGCGCVDPRDPERRGFLLDETFEIDHRVPTRFGGSHDPSNWVAVLRSHHQMKSALESEAASMRNR